MNINDRPTIATPVSVRGGYRVRALCLVDGYPAEILMDVDTEVPRGSTYVLHLFNGAQWVRNVYELEHNEVGHMPMLPQDALPQLQQIAELMWNAANVIVTTARLRNDELDRIGHVHDALALDEARAVRRDQDDMRRGWNPPEVTQGDFVLNDGEARAQAVEEYLCDDGIAVTVDRNPPLASDAQLAELRAKLAGDA